ncbi:hypothetical protein [Micromonospora sp. NPDC005710]|uniref:hypothetical protein n=1 Tax=Micromonospora sp. NPDC005710 TaxID=3157051 RepID=UPI0033DE10DA
MTAVLTGTVPSYAAVVDGTCVAGISMGFSPAVTQPLTPAPLTTITGAGTITTCVFPDGGATTGTLTYTVQGNLTSTSAQNLTGVLDIAWADASTSHGTVTGLSNLGSLGGAAGLTATITAGRFTGDEVQIANLRDPLALLNCLTTGLSQSSGTSALVFTDLA